MAYRVSVGMNEQPEATPTRVAVGTHVEVELVTASGESEHMAFDIVPDSDADFAAGFLGVGTPLAQAIVGQYAGSRVPYTAADVVQVRVLAVASSVHAPAEDAAAKRQAVIREAVSRSDLEDTLRLALTVDVKWGDYDPDGLKANWDSSPVPQGEKSPAPREDEPPVPRGKESPAPRGG